MTWISPNYQNTDFPRGMNLDEKIMIFEDRVCGWQFDIAQQCELSINHSGFAVLQIVTSYFEMIAKFDTGFTRNGRSEEYFKKGVYDIFPGFSTLSPSLQNTILKRLYKDLRCGLYHSGTVGPSIMIDPNALVPFSGNNNTIIINPRIVISGIRQHFQTYIQQLRDPHNSVIRTKFEARFDYQGQ